MTDYRQLCIDLFGTDDVEKLKEIANKKSCAGRKKSLSKDEIQTAVKQIQKGTPVSVVAQKFGVSRQTLSKYLNNAFIGFNLRLDFMQKQKVCTKIYVDYRNKKVKIINMTDDILHRAFGVNENPDWNDYCAFLEERCFPESRSFAKKILEELEITSSYDPLAIIEKTQGRMAEDNQYINIAYLS